MTKVQTAQRLAKFRGDCQRYWKAQTNNDPLVNRPNAEEFEAGFARIMARKIWDEEEAKHLRSA